MSRSDTLLDAVRRLYDAVDRFDGSLATALRVDRTALRAINAMEHGPVSPGALGPRLGLASGSVTALLDRLERAGHIERATPAEDRRRRDAALAPVTRERAGRRYEALGQALRAAFTDADPSRLDAAIQALTAVAQAFDAATVPIDPERPPPPARPAS